MKWLKQSKSLLLAHGTFLQKLVQVSKKLSSMQGPRLTVGLPPKVTLVITTPACEQRERQEQAVAQVRSGESTPHFRLHSIRENSLTRANLTRREFKKHSVVGQSL